LLWYFLKYYFDRKFSLSEEKRKVYKELVELLFFVLNKTKEEEVIRNSQSIKENKKQEMLTELEKKFIEKIKKINGNAILYFPSILIVSRKKFLLDAINYKWDWDKTTLLNLANILLIIRKDMWLENSKLQKTGEDLLVFFLSDYSKYFK